MMMMMTTVTMTMMMMNLGDDDDADRNHGVFVFCSLLDPTRSKSLLHWDLARHGSSQRACFDSAALSCYGNYSNVGENVAEYSASSGW